MSNYRTDRVNMKMHAVDLEALRVIAAVMQRSSGSPFIKPADAIREALKIAREKIVSDGVRGSAATVTSTKEGN